MKVRFRGRRGRGRIAASLFGSTMSARPSSHRGSHSALCKPFCFWGFQRNWGMSPESSRRQQVTSAVFSVALDPIGRPLLGVGQQGPGLAGFEAWKEFADRVG